MRSLTLAPLKGLLKEGFTGSIVEERAEGLEETEYQEVFCETVSSRSDCINKTGAVAMLMGMLTRKGRNSHNAYTLDQELWQLTNWEKEN